MNLVHDFLNHEIEYVRGTSTRTTMNDEPSRLPEERADGSAFDRFQKLTRALFRVDKRDVPKHEPKKRQTSPTSTGDR